MPNNLRVEMQGRGRSGRNGAPGSSELIVNYQKYMQDQNQPTVSEEEFRTNHYENQIQIFSEKVRDEIEKNKMKTDREVVENLRIKD